MAIKGSERPSEKTCNTEGCNAWATKESGRKRCDNCGGKSTGPKTEEGKQKAARNSVTHGLHQSAETFFENADQHHLDTYYGVHEALCARFEQAHGREPMYHDKKELAQVALSIAKLDMADEYAAENAVDESKPLTENEKQMSENGVWEKEVVSKIEGLKTDIRRENRLLLKDKGIYASPESQQANAASELGELVRENLQEDT
jgi:hypothetical protein